MSVSTIEALRRYLSRLSDGHAPPEDALLLERFAADDREAFELLVARHGPMVLGTARRLVGNAHDAEDVFQAVFLSLARQAGSIRRGGALPAWLHRTTCRVAARLRAARPIPTGSPPERGEECDPAAGLLWREVRQALDEELQRLPERLRSPLLLCYLSGLTRDEAARQLGWSLGTLKRRLEEGRDALRVRLERRGLAPVGLALAVLTPGALRAAVGRPLLASSLALVFSKEAAVPAAVSALVVGSAGTLKGVVMKSIVASFVVLALGVAAYSGMRPAAPPKQAEDKKEQPLPPLKDEVAKQDEPLPAGGVLRFGTSRFRQGANVTTLSLSSDGKVALAASENDVPRLFDLTTGRVRRDFGQLRWVHVGAITPDGRWVVVQHSSDLLVCDATTGKTVRTLSTPRENPWLNCGSLALSPDGKTVAATFQGKTIRLLDLASGKMIRTIEIEVPKGGWSPVLVVAFSPDGKRLATGGYDVDKGIEIARLWDVETGKEIRRFLHEKQHYGIRSLAFSPDGNTLATLGENSGSVLRLFDVTTGKELRAFPKDGDQRTTLGCVAFSPDGKTVAAACASIRLYDAATGRERLRIDRKANNLHFSQDGKRLTAAVGGAIYRWDAATGKVLTPEAGDSAVAQILVSADGSRVVTHGHYGEAHLWNGKTGEHLRRFRAGWMRGMAISPDGRFLAWPVDDDSVTDTDPREPRTRSSGTRVRLYEVAADSVVDRLPAVKGDVVDLAFTDDGKRLVTAEGRSGTVRIWNVETGKEERSFQAIPETAKKRSLWVGQMQVSPDGKTVVSMSEVSEARNQLGRGGDRGEPPLLVRLWNVATGKELSRLEGDRPLERAFSPDGRFVVTRSGNAVCEVATGKRVAALPAETDIQSAAFSPDGRFLATAGAGNVIRVWEVATWTRRNEFEGHRDRVTALTFSPNGQLLSGSQDSTVLAWEMRPPRVADSVNLERAWDDLAERDAAKSFRTEGRFLAAPTDAVKLFAAKIQPPKALDRKRVERLIGDLDSDEFAVREAASKALAETDEQATPALEEALKRAASLEVRSRVTRLLERRRGPLTADQIRQNRAVMILERIGGREAKALLKRWAGGPVGARLTAEAVSASKRLEAGASR